MDRKANLQNRVKNIAYFSLTLWSLLCLLASDFPSENPRTQTRNVPYTSTFYAMLKKPTAQIAHLVFADTQANAEKPNELFFANANKT
ncbi:hypothetical protein ACFQ0I_13040 [Mariniflexile aquimaris]|uniref:Uncharacterized protein n=1 Tax=Mariniflexile aquimaris TaxID=881009 RepID=A0ABW3BW19_9FLAO